MPGCHQTVTGAAHVRSGTPNQDRVVSYEHPGWFVLALADGHGAAKCLRSGRGAHLAVSIAAEALESLGRLAESIEGGEADADAVGLRRAIVDRWRAGVDAELAGEPLDGDATFTALPERSRAELAANPRLAYGSTLVAALVTPRFGLFLQLGDGDILLIDAGGGPGEVVRPVAPDARSFANETASLSAPGDTLWSEVRAPRVAFGPGRPAPGLVLLTTDGFPNAFPGDAAFDAAAGTVLSVANTDDVTAIRRRLEGWLTDATNHGSGDDVTVALAFRRGVPGGCAPRQPTEVLGFE